MLTYPAKLLVGISDQSLHPHPFIVYASSEGSDKAMPFAGSSERSLLADEISSKISCAGSILNWS